MPQSNLKVDLFGCLDTAAHSAHGAHTCRGRQPPAMLASGVACTMVLGSNLYGYCTRVELRYAFQTDSQGNARGYITTFQVKYKMVSA